MALIRITERQLDLTEHKIDEAKKLFSAVLDELKTRAVHDPDLTIEQIPAFVLQKLRAAIRLYDQVNRFLACSKNE